MKLESELVDFIHNAIRVCKLVGIDGCILEDSLFAGFHKDRTVAIVHHTVPKLPFKQIGLSRLSDLLSRLEIAKLQDGFNVEASIKPNTDFVFSLVMKGKGTKIDFRCSDPTRIQVKRKANDVMKYRVQITEQVIAMLSKGMHAMPVKSGEEQAVTLIGNSEGVSFELVDIGNDVFKYTFPYPADILVSGETTPQFAHRYSAKLLLSVLKSNPNGYFEIGAGGTLKIAVNGIDVHVVQLARKG